MKSALGFRVGLNAALSLILGALCIGQETSVSEFGRALVDFQSGNYAAAAASFEKAEAQSPGTTDALLYKAKALIHTQDFIGADDALRRYIRRHPDASGALYLLGFVQHRENQSAESLATYTRAAAIVPPTGDDLKIVGLDYVLLNDYADAIHWLERAVEMEPDNKDAWYYLGRAYYTKGQLGQASQAFARVLELSPQDAKAESNLGLIYETNGRIEDAISTYKRAISWQENSASPSAQPYVNMGSLLLEQGNVQGALEFLERAVALAPNDAYCRIKLGAAYRQAGRLPDARRELEKSTQLQPASPIAHYQLGRLYKEMHEVERAQAEFDRTRELQGQASGPSSDLRTR